MKKTLRLMCLIAVAGVTVGLVLASDDGAKAPSSSRLRPGLTAEQTKQAVTVTKEAMRELRKKTEGATEKGADLREFVVGVELLSAPEPPGGPGKESAAPKDRDPARPKTDEKEKEKANDDDAKDKDKNSDPKKAKGPGPRAVVTWYRYFDDITVFSTIDLGTGKIVSVEASQHLRTPLSEDEFEAAQELARDKSDDVKKLYERFGKELSAYPQFSQFTREDDPRINRVVHLTYRVGKRDLSWPRPQVNLTTREVETPAPEADPDEPPKKKRPQ
jgi:hypothetical protein